MILAARLFVAVAARASHASAEIENDLRKSVNGARSKRIDHRGPTDRLAKIAEGLQL
jgi:hypothetical protein